MKAKIRAQFPNGFFLFVDIIITTVAIVAAFALRLAGDTVTDYIGSLYWMVLISLLINPPSIISLASTADCGPTQASMS